MDAFLRQVVRQRESEQFSDRPEADAGRARWLDVACLVRCDRCGKRASFGKERFGERIWCCVGCGGFREALRREKRLANANRLADRVLARAKAAGVGAGAATGVGGGAGEGGGL